MARAMKDSGLKWVGQIPEEWEVTRLKYCVRVRNLFGGFSAARDKYIGLENIVANCGGYIETETEYADAIYAVCRKGDLLYSKLRPYLAKCIISPFDGFCTGELVVFSSFAGDIRYLRYWMTSAKVTEEIDASTRGAKMPRATEQFILNMPLISPPLPEQYAIAKRLDGITGRIESAAAKIKDEIERLERYKKSVITEVVCHGLDPKVKMKDSGIPWVGKIPEGWGVCKIASLYELRSEKVSDKDFPPLSVTMKGILPQLKNVAKTNDGDNRKLVRAGDFAINSRSDRRGACGIAKQDGSVSLINIVLKPRSSIDNGYFDWLFHTVGFADEFYKWGTGIVADMWSTRWQSMKKISVPLPSLPEQREIAAHIDGVCAKVDAVIAKRKQQLERLEALKRSLVYEYVTGKKEVVA